MVKTFTYRNLTWIDIEGPTPQDIAPLVEKYTINALVGEELLTPTRKSKVDVHNDYLYLVLHIPFRTRGKAVQEKEIDFVIGKNFLITTHYESIEPLHNFSKNFETNSILDKSDGIIHAGLVFYYIMKKLYGEMIHDLESMSDALRSAERSIFGGEERKMVEVLSQISREIIDYRSATRLHKEVLDSFNDIPKEFFASDFGTFIEDMHETYATIHDLIVSNKELLTDLRETNDSLLSTKQSEHMKLFSGLAFVTFPLMLILALLTLPTSHTPIIGLQYDWEIIALGVATLAAVMYAYFKDRGMI